jgi:hypothetical protein
MSPELVKHQAGATVRSLKDLIPLIQQDIEEGNHAAETASMPYYRAAGEKLLEAREQLKRGEWEPWVKRNFEISLSTAKRYMDYAEYEENVADGAIGRRRNFTSMTDFQRHISPNIESYQKENLPQRPIFPQTTTQAIKQTLNKVDTEFLNTRRDEVKRAEERDAQRKLALQLIDIGYKALASKLHPDKGGSRDAMARLNAVRGRLKAAV